MTLEEVFMRRYAIVAVAFVLCTVALAKPKTRAFKHPPKQVFEAALRAAREHHVVSYVDEQHLMFAFETGKSMSSYGNRCNVSVEPADNGTSAEMIINTQTKSEKQLVSWGAGGRLADDLFNWTEEKLKAGPAAVPTENKSSQALANTSESGKVMLVSEPEGADVFVDTEFSGNAPATLTLKPGKHAIKVAAAGYEDWLRDLNVLPNSSVNLKATLTKK